MNNFHMREGKVEFRWKRWRNKKRQEVSSCLMVLFSGMVLLGAGGVALAGPTGGQVTGGTGTINQTGTTTNVDQTSNVLNINWQDFSIGANETVNFNQPGADALAINRVVGGVPSFLAGALNANGRVFILNSAGITFTGTSHVNVGALLATTAMTVNGDPTKSASYSGTGYGSVINQGTIEISNGGFAILAAPYVQNTGFVKADLGTIALAGTNQFTLDLSGTGLINFVVPAGTVEQIVNDGKALGVDNSGTLQARSGQVIISANVASQVVNAVVNLNGVVDADAFAPNGTGGSVLVTGAGDINVGGQVTARGSGAGAGGQIVTKAGGADDIEALAFVSAAGGAAGGKGGFIEVSGRTIGLHGNIDPGAGGSIYVDPFNIDIVAANLFLGTLAGSTVTGTQIGTDFIENQLKAGHNVNMDASGTAGGGGNVTFEVMNDDHRLAGGAGNLTVTANRNIIVKGTNDAIVQGGGDILLTANNGNIGSAGHALSLITGVGIPDVGDAAFVTQAGDIVLKAPNGNITVHNVTVKSSGGSTFHALFSASAGNNFTATGDINVQAIAHGAGSQIASATAEVRAGNNINLRNVTVVAHASQTADTGGDAHAKANLDLVAVNGSIDANGNIGVNAFARSAGDGADAQANAVADLDASGSITVHRNIDVTAQANETDSTGSSARACANLELDGSGSINVNGHITVNAFAQGAGHGSVTANAQAAIGGSSDGTDVDVTVNGNIDVSATANHVGTGSGDAKACANLDLDASSGTANINGNIGVSANAQSRGTGTAAANARAEIAAEASGASPDFGNVTVNGSIDLTATANQLSNSGEGAFACANLDIDVTSGHSQASGSAGLINVNGDITVDAFARGNGASNVTANAKAAIGGDGSGTFGSHNGTAVDVRIGGNVDVSATANHVGTGSGAALALANLDVDATSGNVDITGDVQVSANAQGNGTGGLAFSFFGSSGTNFFGAAAKARAEIAAESSSRINPSSVGNVTVGGNIAVSAVANVLHAGEAGGALACANLDVDASFSFGDISIGGDVGVKALATNLGDGDARAQANGELDAEGSVLIHGNVNVDATANQLNGSSGEEARACANLQIAAGTSGGTGNVNINGDVGVDAKALASGSSSARANAQLNIFACNNVNITGNVEALASANQHGLSGSSASANANLQIVAGSSFHSGDINVNGDIRGSANAFSRGSESAIANTFVNLQAAGGDVIVNGVVTANAHATANSHCTDVGAQANASISIFGDPVTLGGIVDHATATSHGSGFANAVANVNVLAASVTVNGNVSEIAKAVDTNTSGLGALANAQLHLNASASSGSLTITGNVGVLASANDHAYNDNANALANVFLHGQGGVDVDGSVSVTANAKLFGSIGSDPDATGVHANAQLLVQAPVGNDSLGAVTVNALAFGTGVFSTGRIVATADFLFGGQNLFVTNATRVHAKASGSHDVFVNPMKAQAKISGSAHHTASFNGGISASASANGDGPGIVQALSQVIVTAENNINIFNHFNVGATAEGEHGGPVDATASASLHGIANPPNVNVTGNAHIHATASGTHLGGSTGLNAKAKLVVNGHDISFDNLAVDASAHGSAHNVFGSANANIQASNDLTVDSNLSVNAIAVQHNLASTGATGAIANAILNAHANHHLTISSDVNVLASAKDSAHQGNANALACVQLTALGTGASAVHLRDVNVTADALDQNGCGQTLADAEVLIQASNAGEGGGVHMCSLNVDASANELAGTANAHANALANAFINAQNRVLASGSNVFVVANAFDGSSANANAKLTVTGSHVVLGNDNLPFDSDTTFGPIGARANARADDTNAQAHALASVQITANNANASIFGTLEGIASASFNHVGGNALNDINATAHVHVDALNGGANITVESINVTADAENWGDNATKAVASLTLNANGSLFLEDTEVVRATAHNGNSQANATGTAAAVASAIAHFNAHQIHAEDSQSIALVAHAINAGHKGAKAITLLDFGAASVVSVDGITLDVLSSELRVNDNGGGAKATAIFNSSNVGVLLHIGDHGINVQAVAHSHGTVGAQAFASVNIHQGFIGIDGPVTVNAEATAGVNGTKGALANAILVLDATTGDLTVGDEPAGSNSNILVRANAHNLGANRASALACAELAAHHGEAGALYTENISIEAFAFDANAHGDTKANAQLLVTDNNGGGLSLANIEVLASADQTHGTASASALALANAAITANDLTFVEGGIAVVAIAQDPGGSAAIASANLLVSADAVIIGSGSRTFNIPNSAGTTTVTSANFGVFVAAVARYNGSNVAAGHGLADANAQVLANHSIGIDGAADVLAFAFDDGGHSANADADLFVNAGNSVHIGSGSLRFNVHGPLGSLSNLTVTDGIFVAAAAIDSPGESGHAAAEADVTVNAGNNANIDAGAMVLAAAIDSSGSATAGNSNAANAAARLSINAHNVTIGAGSITAFLPGTEGFSSALNGLTGTGSQQIAVLVAAVASDGGEGVNHHANALAQASIDPPGLIQINGDVDVIAVAFDNSGAGATANANLLIHGSQVHIGTGSGQGNVAVVAVAVESGTSGAIANAFANARILANGSGTNAISLNGVTVAAFAFDNSATAGNNVNANAQLLISADNGGVNMGGLNVFASASLLGSTATDAVATANANIVANRQIHVNGDMEVTAFAHTDSTSAGDANANAALTLSAGNDIDVEGNVTVNAKATGEGQSSAVANALASFQASSITVNGNVDVTAQANETQSSGDQAAANANVDFDAASGSININGHVTANANAVDAGTESALACAIVELDAGAGGDVAVHGNISVTANANQTNSSSGDDAKANAQLNVLASDSIDVEGNVTVDAAATAAADGSAIANASASFQANRITVNGSVSLLAVADISGTATDDGGDNARANAILTMSADVSSLNVNGPITATANAFGAGSHNSSAAAHADVELTGNTNVTVAGVVTANARAVDNSSGANARATVDVDAHHNITLGGAVALAFASDQGSGFNSGGETANVIALAGIDIGTTADEGNSDSTRVNHVNIAGQVLASAVAVGGSSFHGNVVAIADVQIDEASTIQIGGGFGIHANAVDDSSNSSHGPIAFASGVMEALDSITVNGQISVTAELKSNANGSGTFGSSPIVADEQIDSSDLALQHATAKLHIGSWSDGTGVNIRLAGVTVTANASFTNSSFDKVGQALAGLVIEADNSGSVVINGPVFVDAHAKSVGSGGTMSAEATADISAHSGVRINGNATVKATAEALGTGSGSFANASAELTLETPSGSVSVGFVDVEASAVMSGSQSHNASAFAEAGISARRNVFASGVFVFGDADILNPAGGSANASAGANLDIDAGSNINVGPHGVLVQADASANSAGHAVANALAALDAGTSGVGGIFIQGNDIGLARAIGGGSTNSAFANVHLAAGGASEFGTGAPSNFGNIVVFGNIEAHAFADAVSDVANASVEIFAHNNIFIIGEDPIASARLGPNGSLVAFRQAHFSTNQSVTGLQGTATADIDIRAGGTVTVIPVSSLTHIDKLFALPVDKPTLDSGSLTIIPLTIEGGDCGVLGQAGATEDAIKKAKECHKSPINISDLTSESP